MGKPTNRINIEVKYEGGLDASARRMVSPTLKMLESYAERMKHRVINEQRLGDGSRTGYYVPIKQSIQKLKKNLAISEQRGNTASAAMYRDMLERKENPPKTARRNYNQTGGMWSGLTVKAQGPGGWVTVGFSGSSSTKSDRSGKTTVRNNEKAHVAMTERGRHRESGHLFSPTPQEFNALKAHYAIHVAAGMIEDVKERQKMTAQIKRGAKQDSRLKSALDKYLR